LVILKPNLAVSKEYTCSAGKLDLGPFATQLANTQPYPLEHSACKRGMRMLYSAFKLRLEHCLLQSGLAIDDVLSLPALSTLDEPDKPIIL
jgi:hypothetical protein